MAGRILHRLTDADAVAVVPAADARFVFLGGEDRIAKRKQGAGNDVPDCLDSFSRGTRDDDIDIEAVQIDADTGAETVVMDLASAGYGGRVTVTITIPFNQVSWLSSPMIMDVIDENMELSASTVMRRETVQ